MPDTNDVMQSIAKQSKWFGILMLVLGILAVASPFVAGVAVAYFVAALMIIAGIMRMIHAFKVDSLGSGIISVLLGLVSIIAGGMIFARPLFGLATLTLILIIYFAVEGVFDIIAALKVQPASGWGWLLFSGLISVGLAFLIGNSWPLSGVWAIGILVGVRLLTMGVTMMALGSAAKHMST